MIEAVRTLVAAVAVLAIVLTTGVVGAARGHATAAGEIVICSGGAVVTITVDADGKPTGPAHWCPDCVLTLLAGVADVRVLPQPPAGISVAAFAPGLPAGPGRLPPVPAARGPPSV